MRTVWGIAPIATFLGFTMLGNGALLWSYFSTPNAVGALLFTQIPILLWAGWLFVNGTGRLMMVSGTIAALSALLVSIVAFASLYVAKGLYDTHDQVITHDPGACLYFSVVTLTTLGYGDLIPTPGARIIAASQAIFGFVAMAAMIAVLARAFVGYIKVSDSRIRQTDR